MLIDGQWEVAVWHRKLTQCSVTTWRSGMGCRWGIQEGGDTCILTADSHHCTAETNTLQRNYTPIKSKFKKYIHISNYHVIYFKHLTVLFANSVSKNTLLASHYSWHLIYICQCLQRKKKNFAVSTEKVKMETFLMLKYHLSKRINN